MDMDKIKAEFEKVYDIAGQLYYSDCAELKKHCNNILDILENQDAVKPDIRMGKMYLKGGDPELTVFCGACKAQIIHKNTDFPIEHMKNIYKYCHHCGRKVKWTK